VIGLVTDSNAQLPGDLRERYQVAVVPLTVVVDAYQEGVDITAAEFYERLAAGASVSTAAPSPGAVLTAYEKLAAAGATEVLSIHIGSNTSATVNAVTVAAGSSPVPVEVVDTGTASFAVACCVWAAGEVLAAGGDLTRAADVARRVADEVGNVFIVGALDLARRGGRLAADAAAGDGLLVLALAEGQMQAVGRVHDVESAVDAMTAIGARHQRIPPYRPRANGKVERFNRTLAEEWAYVRLYTSNGQRLAMLPKWVRFYNERRPHTALGGLPPVTRL